MFARRGITGNHEDASIDRGDYAREIPSLYCKRKELQNIVTTDFSYYRARDALHQLMITDSELSQGYETRTNEASLPFGHARQAARGELAAVGCA